MIFVELLIEVIGQIFTDNLPNILRFLGACIKWCFYLGRKDFKTLKDENWNGRLAVIVITLVVLIILKFN